MTYELRHPLACYNSWKLCFGLVCRGTNDIPARRHQQLMTEIQGRTRNLELEYRVDEVVLVVERMRCCTVGVRESY